jgi:hypothetical protein
LEAWLGSWETQKETMKKYFEQFGEIWRLLSSPTRPLEDPKAMDLYAAASSFSLLTFPCTRIMEFISPSVDVETNETSSII